MVRLSFPLGFFMGYQSTIRELGWLLSSNSPSLWPGTIRSIQEMSWNRILTLLSPTLDGNRDQAHGRLAEKPTALLHFGVLHTAKSIGLFCQFCAELWLLGLLGSPAKAGHTIFPSPLELATPFTIQHIDLTAKNVPPVRTEQKKNHHKRLRKILRKGPMLVEVWK